MNLIAWTFLFDFNSNPPDFFNFEGFCPRAVIFDTLLVIRFYLFEVFYLIFLLNSIANIVVSFKSGPYIKKLFSTD